MSRLLQLSVLYSVIGCLTTVSWASDLTKLAPEPLVVHLQGGKGSEKVIFSKAAGISPTKVQATQASGRVNTIPENEITATIQQQDQNQDPNLLTILIKVDTQRFVERGVPYKGVLLIFTQAGKPPEQTPFNVEDDTAMSIEPLQSSLDVAIGIWQSKDCKILIRNNGKTSIDSIVISSSNLTDATTGKRTVVTDSKPDWGTSPIDPDGERVVSFKLPEPNEAGTFVGQLYITANQHKTVGVPFTLRSRGPLGATALPFVLFCLVLGLGFGSSLILDKWFSGGGLARAQAYLSLRNSQSVLVQRSATLQDWKSHLPSHVPPIDLPRTELWLQQAMQSLSDELRSVDSLAQDQLTNDAQQYALSAGNISILWSVLQVATNKWNGQPDPLYQAVSAIDSVPLPKSAAELNQYRANLLAALPVSLGPEETQVGIVSKAWTPEKVKTKINAMSWLYQLAVWITVLFTAYQAYFAHNLAFGSLSDYLVVFLWSLGLTQTGSQILARIHK